MVIHAGFGAPQATSSKVHPQPSAWSFSLFTVSGQQFLHTSRMHRNLARTYSPQLQIHSPGSSFARQDGHDLRPPRSTVLNHSRWTRGLRFLVAVATAAS